jgi:hypothetical protein
VPAADPGLGLTAFGRLDLRSRLASVLGLARDRRFVLALTVLAGGLFRFWGITHGLSEGFVYHQDAQVVVQDAWHHYLGAPWREGRFGVVYGVLVTSAMWTGDAIGRFVGQPPAWSFPLIATAASLVSALAGTLVIPLVYCLGARAYGPGAGLLGAAFLAVEPIHVLHSY